jgi:hypothetical protein
VEFQIHKSKQQTQLTQTIKFNPIEMSNSNGMILYCDMANTKYVGECFNKFTKQGNGVLYQRDIKIYEGEWKNDQRNGKGIEYKNNIKVYEGEWKNNRRSGYGIEYQNGEELYVGQWKNGKKLN